jgi:hypothetical protein
MVRFDTLRIVSTVSMMEGKETKTMNENKDFFNWQDGLKIVLAVMTFGIGWFANNQATVIAFSAMLIVWVIRLAMQKYGYKPEKSSLTVILFVVAIGLSFLFSPIALPIFPFWTGDASTYAPLFIAYFIAFLQIAGSVVAYATGVYNILLAQVFDKLPDATARVISRLA